MDGLVDRYPHSPPHVSCSNDTIPHFLACAPGLVARTPFPRHCHSHNHHHGPKNSSLAHSLRFSSDNGTFLICQWCRRGPGRPTGLVASAAESKKSPAMQPLVLFTWLFIAPKMLDPCRRLCQHTRNAIAAKTTSRCPSDAAAAPPPMTERKRAAREETNRNVEDSMSRVLWLE